MTISSTVRIAGPFTGNGVTTTFPFTYKVFSTADVQVIRLTISTGIETTLTIVTDYNITLNGNQNSNPGGSIVLVTPLLALYTLTATSNIANLQPTDLTNQGGFYPEVITDALDRATIQIQQMGDDVTRSIKAPLSDDLTTMDMTLPVVADRINKILAFSATGMPTAVAQSPSSITGNTSIVGTLDVTGATTLSSTLGVTGATTLASVGVTGAATVGTTLGVTGATTLASVGVTGAATVGTTLGVTGAATIQGLTVGKGGGSISDNSAFGYAALALNTTGYYNNAFGYAALALNTTGVDNNAFGVNALYSNTIGNQNCAFGRSALTLNTTGNYNNAFGHAALANTVSNANSAFGYAALALNTTGYYNSAFGYAALNLNTTGAENCAFGFEALSVNTIGTNNTAFGNSALHENVTGSSNTAVGLNSLLLCTGSNNTALGGAAGNTITTGTNNTCIGYNAQASGAGVSNEITLGTSAITNLRCQDTTITAISDRRDKTDIIDIPTGLEFIAAVRPRSFVWNMRDGGIVGVQAFGFIAQELLEAQTTVGIIVPKLINTNNPDKYEVAPAALLPVIVKAIQELNAKFEAYVATHP